MIINSYSTAAVTTTTSAAKGNGYAGGLVGLNSTGTIKTSYSTGPVSHANIWGVGGLVGYDHHDNGAFEGNYWDVETSGMTTSKGADPMTTTEMKQQATYQGWDFDDVWSIDEGKDYPDLRSNPR